MLEGTVYILVYPEIPTHKLKIKAMENCILYVGELYFRGRLAPSKDGKFCMPIQ